MKKAALVIVSVVSLISVGAVYLYQHQSAQPIKAHSQQDTTVDLSSQKDFFEYSLSSLGEQSLEEIKANVKPANHNQIHWVSTQNCSKLTSPTKKRYPS